MITGVRQSVSVPEAHRRDRRTLLRKDGTTGQAFENPEPCHDFEWSLADVVDAVAAAGMHIETVREWPYSNGCRFFTSMVDVGERRWALPPEGPRLPLMYGLRARAEAS